jgi:hypothetical protein
MKNIQNNDVVFNKNEENPLLAKNYATETFDQIQHVILRVFLG